MVTIFAWIQQNITSLEFFIGVIGVLLTVLAIFLAIKTIRQDRNKAQQSVTSDIIEKPRLVLSFNNLNIGQKFIDNYEWIFFHPGKGNEIAYFPLQFLLANEGEAVAKDIIVTFKTKKDVFGKQEDHSPYMSSPSVMTELVKYSIDKIQDFHVFTTRISSVPNNAQIQIEVPFFCAPTTIKVNLYDLRPEDGFYPLRGKARLQYTFIFSINLQGENIEPSDYELRLGVMSISEFEPFIHQTIKEGSKNKISNQTLLSEVINLFTMINDYKVINFVTLETDQQTRVNGQRHYILKCPQNFIRKGIITDMPHEDVKLQAGQILSIATPKQYKKSTFVSQNKRGNLIRRS